MFHGSRASSSRCFHTPPFGLFWLLGPWLVMWLSTAAALAQTPWATTQFSSSGISNLSAEFPAVSAGSQGISQSQYINWNSPYQQPPTLPVTTRSLSARSLRRG